VDDDMTSKLQTTDRLRDRGFIDQWGFIAFAVVGFAGIVSAKAFEIPTTWVAVGAVAAMLSYAVIIARSGTGRVRADQAGDNCYYLGLIYTLASLSYAIATFDPADTATTIVQGFGIALVTTIFGLILRVFFSQGRPDLENVEEQTRLEMTDAVVRLKAELGDVVRQLNDFTRIVQLSMTELQQSATESVSSFTSSSVQGLQGVVEAATSTIRDEANDFASRSKRYSATFDKLLAKLEQHAESVDQMREAQEIVQLTAKAAEAAVGSAGIAMGALQASAEGARSAAASTQDAIESVKDLVQGLSRSVEKMEATIGEIHKVSVLQIEELRSGPSRSVSEAASALSQASEALKGQVSEAGQLHAQVHAGITARNEAALEASKRVNAELEAELLRSAGLVRKVHSSLAEMTSKLADTVESSA
jgi:cytochrome c556